METGRIGGNPNPPKEAPRRLDAKAEERAAADRLDEIRQHFRDEYARREVVVRTTTPSGQELDWVPGESQPSEAMAEPPEMDIASSRSPTCTSIATSGETHPHLGVAKSARHCHPRKALK